MSRPLANPRDRSWHRHDVAASTERCRSVTQGPIAGHDEMEFPSRAKLPHLRDQLQQDGFGAPELVRHTDERDAHQLAGFRPQRTTLSESSLGKLRASALG